MGLFDDIKKERRIGANFNKYDPVIRLFGTIVDVAERDEGKKMPLVKIKVEGQESYVLGGRYIPLAYSQREYATIFGDTDIKGSYVEVLIDANQKVGTARILALPEEIQDAREHGGSGNTILSVLATAYTIDTIEKEGVPATKQFLY